MSWIRKHTLERKRCCEEMEHGLSCQLHNHVDDFLSFVGSSIDTVFEKSWKFSWLESTCEMKNNQNLNKKYCL